MLDAPIGYWADFLYTIPSLALFQLLVPFTGITVLTVEIALVSYTLLVLYRNMMEGLSAVPAEVIESARGSGFTRTQTFLRVELPLATPTIMAGVRIATVSTISIATVAAFVLPQGLGYPLFIALRQDVFKTEIFAAGALAVALALTADGLLHLLERALTPWMRTGAAAHDASRRPVPAGHVRRRAPLHRRQHRPPAPSRRRAARAVVRSDRDRRW